MGRYTKYFLLCGIALLSVESFFNNGTVYRLYQKGKKVVVSGITLVGGGQRKIKRGYQEKASERPRCLSY